MHLPLSPQNVDFSGSHATDNFWRLMSLEECLPSRPKPCYLTSYVRKEHFGPCNQYLILSIFKDMGQQSRASAGYLLTTVSSLRTEIIKPIVPEKDSTWATELWDKNPKRSTRAYLNVLDSSRFTKVQPSRKKRSALGIRDWSLTSLLTQRDGA